MDDRKEKLMGCNPPELQPAKGGLFSKTRVDFPYRLNEINGLVLALNVLRE
jgi:hypothetical protein